MYKLGKRVISQFIRTGCRRRLRLDLYQTLLDRDRADVPEKDASRPGLALLSRQGKEYEREKFRELESIFPDLVVRGSLKEFEAAEERAFEPIRIADCIDALNLISSPSKHSSKSQLAFATSITCATWRMAQPLRTASA